MNSKETTIQKPPPINEILKSSSTIPIPIPPSSKSENKVSKPNIGNNINVKDNTIISPPPPPLSLKKRDVKVKNNNNNNNFTKITIVSKEPPPFHLLPPAQKIFQNLVIYRLETDFKTSMELFQFLSHGGRVGGEKFNMKNIKGEFLMRKQKRDTRKGGRRKRKDWEEWFRKHGVNVVFVPEIFYEESSLDVMTKCFELGLPLVKDQYLKDCLRRKKLLGVREKYLITRNNRNNELLMKRKTQLLMNVAKNKSNERSISSSGLGSGSSNRRVNYNNNIIMEGIDKRDNELKPVQELEIRMQLKSAPCSTYSDQFSQLLYTLTWSNRYDLKLTTNLKCFERFNEENLNRVICVHLLDSETKKLPVFVNENNAEKVGGGGMSKKAGVKIFSISKFSDFSIGIRFGISKLYCSRRFKNKPFCLGIVFTDRCDICNMNKLKYLKIKVDNHFVIYTPEFLSFASKYTKLDDKVKNNLKNVMTAKTYTRIVEAPIEYCPFFLMEPIRNKKENQNAGKVVKSKKSKTKKRRKKKKRKYKVKNNSKIVNINGENGQIGIANNLDFMNFLKNGSYQPPSSKFSGIIDNGDFEGAKDQKYNRLEALSRKRKRLDVNIKWMGKPIAINEKGDSFFYGFYKDDRMYLANDFVFVDLSGTENEKVKRTRKKKKKKEEIKKNGDSKSDDKEEGENVDEIEKIGDLTTTSNDKKSNDSKEDKKESNSTENLSFENCWICKLIHLIQTKHGEKKFVGQWYYRYSDLEDLGYEKLLLSLRQKNNFMILSENEVFHTMDFHYEFIHRIRGKCFVSYIGYRSLNNSTTFNPKNFFFQFKFNREIKNAPFEIIPQRIVNFLKSTTNSNAVAKKKIGNSSLLYGNIFSNKKKSKTGGSKLIPILPKKTVKKAPLIFPKPHQIRPGRMNMRPPLSLLNLPPSSKSKLVLPFNPLGLNKFPFLVHNQKVRMNTLNLRNPFFKPPPPPPPPPPRSIPPSSQQQQQRMGNLQFPLGFSRILKGVPPPPKKRKLN